MNWQNYQIIEDVKLELDEFVKSRFYLLGKYLKDFEDQISDYLKIKSCIGVSNGTIAIQLLLRNLNLKQGSLILVSSFCPIPTIMAIIQEGFVPHFVDIEKDTLNISKRTLKESYNLDCSAVVAIHIFGKLCPMIEIKEFCDENNLMLIEDACQAFSSFHPNYKIAELSKGAAMSFYPTKNLGSWGDAGAILSNNDELAYNLKCMRNYGLNDQFVNEMIGGNYRMDDFQAMVLLKKMKYIAKDIEKRSGIVENYKSFLNEESFQRVEKGEFHNYHVISYLLENKNQKSQIKSLYKEYKIRDTFFYETPVYYHKSLKKYFRNNLKNTDFVCGHVINLPNQILNNDFYEKLQRVVEL